MSESFWLVVERFFLNLAKTDYFNHWNYFNCESLQPKIIQSMAKNAPINIFKELHSRI